jgi:predicted DNA-binding protein
LARAVEFPEFSDAFAGIRVCVPFMNVAFLPHHAIVLWPELLTKILAAAFACGKENGGSNDNRRNYDQQYHNLRIHSPSLCLQTSCKMSSYGIRRSTAVLHSGKKVCEVRWGEQSRRELDSRLAQQVKILNALLCMDVNDSISAETNSNSWYPARSLSDIYDRMSDMSSSRITVRVPEALTSRLRSRSRAKGTTESELVREALESYLGSESSHHTAYELAEAAGIIATARKLPKDLSTNPRHMKGFGKK